MSLISAVPVLAGLGSAISDFASYNSNKSNIGSASSLNDVINMAKQNANENWIKSEISASRSRAFNERMFNYSSAFNAQQAQLNREWQERMSNTAHQREVADLKAAGLNPVLSVTGGAGASVGSGATASASASSSAQGSPDNSVTGLLSGIINGIMNMSITSQNILKDIQVANIAAEASMANARTSAEASMYNARTSANATMSAASMAASASRYSADSSRSASQYGSDVSAAAQKYNSDVKALIELLMPSNLVEAGAATGANLAGFIGSFDKSVSNYNKRR